MDIEAATGALATLVGLICNWKQERGNSDQQKYQSFMLWLENHNFHELRARIETSDQLSRELNALLEEDLKVISSKLDVVCDAVTAVAQRIDGLSGFAAGIGATSEGLSDQACVIVKWFAAAGSDRYVLFHHPRLKPSPYQLSPSAGGMGIFPGEPQFFPDDMSELERLGYIRIVDYTSRDRNPIYSLTRSGARFSAQLPDSILPAVAPEE